MNMQDSGPSGMQYWSTYTYLFWWKSICGLDYYTLLWDIFAAKLICWFQTPTIVLIFLLLYLYSNQHWVHADTCYGLWEGGLYPYTEQCLIMRACHSKYRMRNELELVFESNRRKISIMHEFLSWIPVWYSLIKSWMTFWLKQKPSVV